jgi:chromosome segregation ATPase
MKLLVNPSGLLVDVNDDQAEALLAIGFSEPSEAQLKAEEERLGEQNARLEKANVADLDQRILQLAADLEAEKARANTAETALGASKALVTQLEGDFGAWQQRYDEAKARIATMDDEAKLLSQEVAAKHHTIEAIGAERDAVKAELAGIKASPTPTPFVLPTAEELEALPDVSAKAAKSVYKLLSEKAGQ